MTTQLFFKWRVFFAAGCVFVLVLIAVIVEYIDGLVQDCSNCIANALELLQSCTKPSICGVNNSTWLMLWICFSLIWVGAVATAILIFLYLIGQQLQKYFEYPKSVLVEVDYQSQLPFPAVTVCNQNLFRWSKTYLIYILVCLYSTPNCFLFVTISVLNI